MPLRYGIVGCAGIGTTHADGVRAADGVELVACADVAEENAREFAAEHDCEAFTDVATMVDAAEVDAVSVCTPSGTHADVTAAAAEAGAHVLCEKPLDVYADRVDRMIDVADSAGVTLAGVFQHRTGPGPRRVREAFEGDLGDPLLADVQVKWRRDQAYYDQADWRGTREMDGGVLMNQAIHGIDMLQWLAGDVERVHAKVGTLARDIEVEDTAVAAVEFAGGGLGVIEATTTHPSESETRLELTGDDCHVRLEGGGFDLAHLETANGVQDPATEDVEWGSEHARQIQDFVDAVREGREPMVPAREARKAVDVILAIYESSEQGRPVDVDGQ